MIFLRRPISRLFIGQFQARNLKTCFEILSSAEFYHNSEWVSRKIFFFISYKLFCRAFAVPYKAMI